MAVTVKRTGNLNQYAIVLCRTEPGTATSTSGAGSQPGRQDYVEHAGQVLETSYTLASRRERPTRTCPLCTPSRPSRP